MESAAERLRAERAATGERLAALRRDLQRIFDSADTATDDEHDPEGVTAFERAQTSALIDAAVERLAELDRAEAALAAGTYGRCAGCGGSIPPQRLAARPTASTCISCASAR